MANKGVLIFESYYEVIKDLNDSDQLQMYKAICEYGINGNEPNLTGALKGLWTLIKPNIDSSINRYNTSVINGGKGGRPKKEKPNENPQITKEKPKIKPKIKPENNHDKDIDKDNNKDIDNKVFIPEQKNKLVLWIEEKCPQVAKMKSPLTNDEAERLINDFDKDDIIAVFNSMDNYAKLHSTSISANKTFRNWAKRDKVLTIAEKRRMGNPHELLN